MSRLWVEMMNRRRWHGALLNSWSKSYVSRLTSELYQQDLQGLRCGFGPPYDEYEPEALALVAVLSGETSWRVGDLTSDVVARLDAAKFETRLAELTATEVSELLSEIFRDAFSGNGGAYPHGQAALESLRCPLRRRP